MPPTEQNNVWISREEYDRLQAAAQPAVYVAPQPVVTGNFESAATPAIATKSNRIPTFIGVALGGSLLLAMSTNQTFIGSALIIVFLIWAIYDAIRHPRTKSLAVQANSQSSPNVGKSVVKTLAIIAGLLILAPILASGAMFIIFIVLISFGGNQGS